MKMLALKRMILGAVTFAALTAGAETAFADGCGMTCEPTYAPAPRYESVMVTPGHYETRMERVETPGRWVDEEKVTEIPGHYETQCQTVEIPGRYEKVEKQVWVEGRWVERPNQVSFGDRRFNVGICPPAREWIPGHYETCCEQVWIPPTCERREVQVWVPCARKVEIVRVFKPGCPVERPIQVWVPAKYEQRCVSAPAP